MNTAQKVVIMVTAIVITGLLTLQPPYKGTHLPGDPFLIIWTNGEYGYGRAGLSTTGCRVLAALTLGAALVAVLHKRRPS